MGVEEVGQFQLHLLREKTLALGTIALAHGRSALPLQKNIEAIRISMICRELENAEEAARRSEPRWSNPSH